MAQSKNVKVDIIATTNHNAVAPGGLKVKTVKRRGFWGWLRRIFKRKPRGLPADFDELHKWPSNYGWQPKKTPQHTLKPPTSGSNVKKTQEKPCSQCDREQIREMEWLDNHGESQCSACGFSCGDDYYLGAGRFCPECGARARKPLRKEERQ